MSGRKSEVVYRRPKAGYEEFDPENWDDSAIAKAYDTAVKKVDRSSINVSPDTTYDKGVKMEKPDLSNGISHQQPPTIYPINDEHKSREVYERQSKTNVGKEQETDELSHDTKWKLGDACMAVYYEDGLYYHCKVKALNRRLGTCVVEYQGYGNQETLNIVDLHRIEEWEENEESANCTLDSKTSCSSSSTTCTFSTQSTDETSSDITQDIYRRSGVKKKNHKQKSKKRNSDHALPPLLPNLGFNPYLMMPPPPFVGGPLSFHIDKKMVNSQTPQFPDIADDALSSMLMSWYMAGYHTGYYQGLNERKSENPKSSKRKNKH